MTSIEGETIMVRADAGVSSPALPWLATEMLAAGLLLGVAAVVLIIVPARLAGRPGPATPSPMPASGPRG
jgi:hypothetical protein